MNGTIHAVLLVLVMTVGVCGRAALAHVDRPSAKDPPPNVALTLAVIDAGGGAQHYDTVALFRTLAGHLAGAELLRLRVQYGKANVASFLSVFNFMVGDIVTTFRDQHVEMNISPAPDPHDGKALASALLSQAARPDGTLSTDTMLDHLLSPATNSRIKSDAQKKFGVPSYDNYRTILLQTLGDMKRAYHL